MIMTNDKVRIRVHNRGGQYYYTIPFSPERYFNAASAYYAYLTNLHP